VSKGGEDWLLDDDTLALANEVMQTLYTLFEKQVDTAGWAGPVCHSQP
jgi:hypothetical protein